MKMLYGGYKEHGRTYHVDTCSSCFATVTMTAKEFKDLRRLAGFDWNEYFNANIPCCDTPSFFWGMIKEGK